MSKRPFIFYELERENQGFYIVQKLSFTDTEY